MEVERGSSSQQCEDSRGGPRRTMELNIQDKILLELAPYVSCEGRS